MDADQLTLELVQDAPRHSMQRIVRHLDLFSGIGGFALAAKMVGGIETVGFCEIHPWARRVLNKNFPGVPIHNDIKTLNPENYERIDLITGGFPCQPYSTSGKRRGSSDDRALWPDLLRVVAGTKCRWLVGENVAGITNMELDRIIIDLAGIGYASRIFDIPASGVGAFHRRHRVWILAHADNSHFMAGGRNGASISGSRIQAADIQIQQTRKACREDGLRIYRNFRGDPVRGTNGNRWDQTGRNGPSGICRVAHGIPGGMDRLRGLGNAIVPQVAAEILRTMMYVDSLTNSQAQSRPALPVAECSQQPTNETK